MKFSQSCCLSAYQPPTIQFDSTGQFQPNPAARKGSYSKAIRMSSIMRKNRGGKRGRKQNLLLRACRLRGGRTLLLACCVMLPAPLRGKREGLSSGHDVRGWRGREGAEHAAGMSQACSNTRHECGRDRSSRRWQSNFCSPRSLTPRRLLLRESSRLTYCKELTLNGLKI